MAHLNEAVKIANAKYPQENGWRIFDHSSCHAAMPDDALDVSKMNLNPSGKQRVMCDRWWGVKPEPIKLCCWRSKGNATRLGGVGSRHTFEESRRNVCGTWQSSGFQVREVID